MSKVLVSKFRYDYNKNKFGNNSKLLFTDTDSLLYEIKIEDVCEDFSKDKEMFDFGNYSAKSKYYNDSNELVVGKMKDETAGVAVKQFVGSKSWMYVLVDDSGEHKKPKDVNRNFVATMSYWAQRSFLDKKCLKKFSE